jgi:hypothetical protein
MRNPEHRHCEGPCCGRVFVPQRRNQRYCQKSCGDAADSRRRNAQGDTLTQVNNKMLNYTTNTNAARLEAIDHLKTNSPFKVADPRT